MTDQLSSDLPSPDTTKVDEAYQEFCRVCSMQLKKLHHVDVDTTAPHAGLKSVKAPAKTSHPLLMDQSPEGLLRLCCKNLTKKDEGDGMKLSNSLTLPTLVVGHGPLSTTLQATPYNLFATALFLQTPLLRS